MSVSDMHGPAVKRRNMTGTDAPHQLSRMLIKGAVAFCGIMLLAGIYGRLMNYGLRRDEMMFVPPAAFLPGWDLYQDFFYNHVPNSAWYFKGVNLFFGEAGLLFAARFGVFLGWLALVGSVFWVTLRISKNRLFAFFCAVAMLTADPLLGEAGMAASNNLLPLPFAVLGLGLFIMETLKQQVNARLLFCAGVCLSIAAGMKISAVIFIPPVAIAAFLLPLHMGLADRFKRVVFPLLVGGLIGALPLFWYLISDTELFLAHVIGFHLGPHIAYWDANAYTEPNLAMGLGGKLLLAYGGWLAGVPLIMGVVATYLVWVALRDKSTGHVREEGYFGQLLVCFGAICLAILMSFSPTPGFPQYYVLPLVCLPIFCAVVFRRISPDSQRAIVPLLGASMLVMMVLAAPRLGAGVLALTQPDKLTVSRISTDAQRLNQIIVQDHGLTGPVATFLPIYPLEADLPVYAEFASGQFAYRIVPYTAPELAAHYTMVGEDGLDALFAQTPPAAFLLGYAEALEGPMLRYAQANGYQLLEAERFENRYGPGQLYIRTRGGE
ncbi:hypothetical protein [uncultured Roseobacter sp.]|uniref:hypothetical protein n=1 Tax=uncultured Roseobacter sp. TaxID=114847 RepID=UPI002629D097|nr:hypothetical protein [uncultured Roseobacter sp.]